MLYKATNIEVKDIDEKGLVKFYYNAFGNIDSDGDISKPGSHRKSQNENWSRIKHFKNHNINLAPGKIQEMGEDVTGAWAVSKLVLGSTIGRDTFEEYKAGIITEHSFGFDVINSFQNDQGQRVITEYKVWEVSSLTAWGANAMTPTIAVKSESEVLAMIESLMMLKKGKFSDEYLKNIELKIAQLHKHIKTLAEPEQSTQSEPDENELSELVQKKLTNIFKN